MELKGYQRAALLRQAHALRPVVYIGKAGLTDAVLALVQTELDNHELIKIRFGDFKDARRALTDRMGSELGATVVGVIGHVAILYRRAKDPQDRTIVVPVR